jgi:glyoxylase-like metal-dependent hydrolase (beta-lactamase superfamily II)
MPNHICVTCGTQYEESEAPPAGCPVCEDERQYVGAGGQRWTTVGELRATHENRIAPEGPGVTGIGTVPDFAIGQRALLVRAPGGNVLWDCVALWDDRTARALEALGGVSAVAISHPHYYTTMVEWARALDVPVYLHAADREWVMRHDPRLVFWDGETREIGDGLTLVRLGGHFPGGQVLHWRDGAEGRGALLAGDIIQVVPDTRWVSFMYSYPNLIPLPAGEVLRIASAVRPLAFEHVYGAWWGRNVTADGRGAVLRSAERYVAALRQPRAPAPGAGPGRPVMRLEH